MTEKHKALSQEEIESLIERFEAPTRALAGYPRKAATVLGVAMSLFALYASIETVNALAVRALHLLFALILIFLFYPAARRFRTRVNLWDWVLMAGGLASVGYVAWFANDLQFRAAVPNFLDLILAAICLLLVLEATRRTAGWSVPLVAASFLAYALWGSYLPEPWSHPEYDLERVLGYLYMYPDGVFGLPLDVSSTFIILFTIFGAVLECSGAGDFFVQFALRCTGRSATSAGRTVTLASFLLGTVSGSGVATTVTLGSVAYPMLKKAGYDKESAGGMLAAGGIGAVISPPVLGAASFLIAEILRISYLEVLKMAVIPTILYYFSIFLMVEADSRRMNLVAPQTSASHETVWSLARTYWFHFSSLITIVIFMGLGFSATRAVIYATLVAWLASYLTRETALGPGKIIKALEGGAKGVIPVAAICACAGIIVGSVTMSGLGLKFSTIIVNLAGANKLLCLIYAALILLVLGLALPITASYIIAAVIMGPALVSVGVPEYAAHMFIFYYSVLSEVSPPTALSPFAAAALTGGSPFKTMMLSWKYTLPAFIVPFAFAISTQGDGILLKGQFSTVLWMSLVTLAGIAALAGAVGGWLLGMMRIWERLVLLAIGLTLYFAPSYHYDLVALVLMAAMTGYKWTSLRQERLIYSKGGLNQ